MTKLELVVKQFRKQIFRNGLTVFLTNNYLLAKLEHQIFRETTVLGHDISTRDRSLFSLPVRFGGLNIRDSTINTKALYDACRCATEVLIDAIQGDHEFCLADHDNLVTSVRYDWINEQQPLHNRIFSDIFESSDAVSQRSLPRNKESLSAWLTAVPLLRDDFHLSATEFRDALCLRYMKPLLQLPPYCDGCGSIFTTSHALDCRKGGLVIHRHHEIRDLMSDLS